MVFELSIFERCKFMGFVVVASICSVGPKDKGRKERKRTLHWWTMYVWDWSGVSPPPPPLSPMFSTIRSSSSSQGVISVLCLLAASSSRASKWPRGLRGDEWPPADNTDHLAIIWPNWRRRKKWRGGGGEGEKGSWIWPNGRRGGADESRGMGGRNRGQMCPMGMGRASSPFWLPV